MPNLNFAGVDSPGFDPVPNGWYDVRIEEVDTRETSSDSKHPDNEFWNVQMEVTSGDYKGRKLFTNLMLPCEECAANGGPGSVDGHDNKDYSPFMLLGILQAVGLVGEDDSWDGEAGDLEGLEFQAYAKRKKDDPEQNEVRKFRASESADQSGVI